MLTNRYQLAEIGRCLTLVAVTLLLAACAAVPPAPTLVVAQLAPNGTLRAAINYGNPLLAKRDADGAPRGVSVDLARELGRRLGVPVELVTYTAAGKVVAGIQAGEWDVAFYAIDPVRAVDTEFSAPYLLIEGAYLVPDASPIRRSEDVDREGVRVAAAKGSAYDLYLTRALKHATLVHAPTSQQVTDTLLAQKLDVAAGVRQQMQADVARLPGLRLLDGRFMEIRQAMAVPTGRRLGAAYVAEFVEQMKASGFIAESLRRHGIEGVTLAEPVPRPIR
jgi:polar amino acid transport system substrate-binding protein